MYRRPKFLEILLEIRREMALEADYDVDLFAEIARSGSHAGNVKTHELAPAETSLNSKAAAAQNGAGKLAPISRKS
jgi:hypothetical protein